MNNQLFEQPTINTSQEQFSNIASVDTPRSRFSRNHDTLTTFDNGKVIPILVDEILPGDTVEMTVNGFVRLATPLRPLFHRIDLDVFAFFCPCRLTWDNWEKFMGERTDPADDPDLYSIPQLEKTMGTTAPTAADLDLWHYMGLPYVCNSGTPTLSVNALPFRALALVWNQWFRDENIQDSINVSTGDTVTTWPSTEIVDLQPRNKKKDYFSSCLPWPQKGDAAAIPLGNTAYVKYDVFSGATTHDDAFVVADPATSAYEWNYGATQGTDSGQIPGTTRSNLYADLSNASTITVNTLRDSITMQQFLERDARGGTRYIELILSHFGVQSSDSRLQRTELLGYGTGVIQINPIAQTSESGTTPQANLSAVGVGSVQMRFTKAFEEHGYLLVVTSARTDLVYQRAINKLWLRDSRFDFPWPEFSHLGEQAVQNQELHYTGTATDTATFGYQERYAEIRYKPSMVTGLFNSDCSSPLDVYHLAEDFGATVPALNSSFVQESAPLSRVNAVATEPDFIGMFNFDYDHTRCFPIYSVPGLETV